MAVKNVLSTTLIIAMLTLMACGSDYLNWDLARINPNDSPGTTNTSGTGGTSGGILVNIKNNLNRIQFVNNSIAYAVGDGIVIKSINGGLKWVKINSSSTINFTALYFVNASLGYLGGNDQYYSYIFRTLDGGLTWQQLNRYWFQNERNKVTSIFASSSGERVVAFINQYPNSSQVYGHMMYSSNSGNTDTWSTVQTNRKVGFNTADLINGNIFIGGNAYWTGTTHQTSVFMTTFLSNGSLALTEYKVTQSTTNPISFNRLDMAGDVVKNEDRYGFATTNNGLLAITSDTGKNWTLKSLSGSSPTQSVNLNAILFPSSTTGFIGFSSGLILKTEDSGFSWFSAFQVADEILDLAHRPDGKVFVVGKNGLIQQIN